MPFSKYPSEPQVDVGGHIAPMESVEHQGSGSMWLGAASWLEGATMLEEAQLARAAGLCSDSESLSFEVAGMEEVLIEWLDGGRRQEL